MIALRHPETAARGFTLIELVVSMALLTVVLSLLFSALWFTARSWRATELQRDGAHSLALIQETLARQLRQARPLYGADARGQRAIAFAGTADQLQYVAPLTRQHSLLYLNTLYLEDGPAGRSLRLRYAPFHPNSDSPAQAASLELLPGIEALHIDYYGVPEQATAAGWFPAWQHARALPERIRIRIRTREAGDWPELLVRPGGGVPGRGPTHTTQAGADGHAG